LFEVEFFGAPGAAVLDPACGWGRIPRAAAAAGYTTIASDIVDRRRELDVEFHICDFLKHSPVRSVRSVVSNPPFTHIQKFCEHALKIATYKVGMLVPMRRLPAAHWLQRLPLETIHLLTPRPSMPTGDYIVSGGKVAGGTSEFCWLIFNKTTAPTTPQMKWLHRDGDSR
jgi:predicted RNA methylase